MDCIANSFILNAPGVSHTVHNKSDPAIQAVYQDIEIKLGFIRWADGETLQVGFLGGDAWQKQTVAAVAVEWCKYATIKFNFGGPGPYDILVAFDTAKGSWSYLGNQCRSFAQKGQPSMNLGWVLPNHGQARQTILHEFGHALGLPHQHQNPDAKHYEFTNFNRQAVYNTYMQPPNNWSQNMIDLNIFATYRADPNALDENKKQARLKGNRLLGWESERLRFLVQPSFDIHSIMMYPFPASLMQGGIGGTNTNQELSDWDKSTIHMAYPSANNSNLNILAQECTSQGPQISELIDAGETPKNWDWRHVRRDDGTVTTVGQLNMEKIMEPGKF